MTTEAQKTNIRFQAFALAVGAVLLIGKFIAWWLTSSNSILSDMLESIIHVPAAAFGLYSLILSARPPDKNHPYGHGKIEFISAGFEGGLVLLAGMTIMVKAVYNFFVPVELSSLDLGILITAAAGAINFLVGRSLEIKGKKANSLQLIASGKHLQSDTWSTVGMLAGLGIIYFTKIDWLDNVVAIIFGLLIGYTGYKILRKSVAGIMDEADFELLGEIVQTLSDNREPNWIDVHNLRVIKVGNLLHVDCHLTLPWYLTVAEGHAEAIKVESLIREKHDARVQVFIHTDACKPDSCKLCLKTDCEVRKHKFEQKLAWTLENVMENRQHRLG